MGPEPRFRRQIELLSKGSPLQRMRDLHLSLMAFLVTFTTAVAQTDSTSHRVQFVAVDEGVQVEVLDWGGVGRPLIFWRAMGTRLMRSTVLRRSLPA